MKRETWGKEERKETQDFTAANPEGTDSEDGVLVAIRPDSSHSAAIA